MRYLLDTHVLIWSIDEEFNRIPQKTLNNIDNLENEIFISIASLWEITIKLNIGKFKPNLDIDDVYNYIRKSQLMILNIEENHLLEYRHLPLIHREPFDRLIIATTISENLTLITHDKEIQKYPINWLWE